MIKPFCLNSSLEHFQYNIYPCSIINVNKLLMLLRRFDSQNSNEKIFILLHKRLQENLAIKYHDNINTNYYELVLLIERINIRVWNVDIFIIDIFFKVLILAPKYIVVKSLLYKPRLLVLSFILI